MFHFSIDIKDASSISEAELAKHSIFEDNDFKGKIINEFKVKNPDFEEKNSDSYYELEDTTYNEVFFKAEALNPKSAKKAVEMIMDIFFFPPLRVWIKDKEYDTFSVSNSTIIRF